MKKTLTFIVLVIGIALTLHAQDNVNQTDKNGLKQGIWVKYYESGAKIYEGEFKDDKPIGTFKYYYDNKEFEEVKVNMKYSYDGIKSRATMYHIGGEIMAIGNYVNQKKDSVWMFFDSNGKLSCRENYVEGEKDGLSITYFLEEKIAEEKHWKNGVAHGEWKQYFKNGDLRTMGTFVDGNLDGNYVVYYPDGKVNTEGNYQDAVKHGVWTEYNDSIGTVHVKRYYELGELIKTEKINGVFKEVYLSEIPKEEITYKDGKKNGYFKEYYDKGEFKTKPFKFFEDDEETGEMIEYLDGTQLKCEGNYKNDQLDGEITYYKEDGSIDKVELYKEGILIKH